MRRSTSPAAVLTAFFAVVGFLLAVTGAALLATPAYAQTATTTGTTTAGAGQSGTPGAANGNTIYVFCLDFGKPFPTGQSIAAQGLADNSVRGALNYALTKGYITSNPYQVQLAVWKLSNGDFHDVNNQGTTIAQEIVNNATTTPSGTASDVGTLTIGNIQPADANAAYGTGTVSGTVPTNLPVGFLLPAQGNFQRLASVANVSALQTTTTAGTGTTAAATTVATAAATTAAATSAAVTDTVAATTAAATDTAAATTAATETVVVGAATTGPTVSVPATGEGGMGGGNGLTAGGIVLLFLGLTLLIVAGIVGLAVNRRRALS